MWLSEADIRLDVIAVCDVGIFVDLDGPNSPRLLRSSDRCFAVAFDSGTLEPPQ